MLEQLVGRWQGMARLWLRPDELYAEGEVRGEVVPIHGGRWVMHTYETPIDGADTSGTQLVGAAGDRAVWQIAWVDTWHTAGEIFLSEGALEPDAGVIAVATTYGAEPEVWGWRTELAPAGDELTVRHFNVTPQGDEALAVEFAYRRA